MVYVDDRPRFRRRQGDLAASPEIWAALNDGKLLRPILEEFYDHVFEDERLAPFFEQTGVTKSHIVGKQHAFLVDIFTGERVYFGDRPRNAHHWMVISSALYDHREALMERILRKYGLPESVIARWMRIENTFRKQIIKAAPIPKKLHGITLPLDGWAPIALSAGGGMCDACERAVDEGETAFYHRRTGKMHCRTCAPGDAVIAADTAADIAVDRERA